MPSRIDCVPAAGTTSKRIAEFASAPVGVNRDGVPTARAVTAPRLRSESAPAGGADIASVKVTSTVSSSTAVAETASGGAASAMRRPAWPLMPPVEMAGEPPVSSTRSPLSLAST